MEIHWILLVAFLSYLLGSIPSAVWIGRRYHGIDVRDHGSGNAGATNTFRVLGVKTGIAVLAIDMVKGLVAVSFAYVMVPQGEWGNILIVNLKLLFGISAVIGHIFPIFAQFRGGKGIATLLGLVIGLDYRLAISCAIIFIAILLLTRYVSLGSMLATLSFPITAYFLFHREEPLLIAFGLAASIMVIVTHHKNILKLIRGEENKAKLFKRYT